MNFKKIVLMLSCLTISLYTEKVSALNIKNTFAGIGIAGTFCGVCYAFRNSRIISPLKKGIASLFSKQKNIFAGMLKNTVLKKVLNADSYDEAKKYLENGNCYKNKEKITLLLEDGCGITIIIDKDNSYIDGITETFDKAEGVKFVIPGTDNGGQIYKACEENDLMQKIFDFKQFKKEMAYNEIREIHPNKQPEEVQKIRNERFVLSRDRDRDRDNEAARALIRQNYAQKKSDSTISILQVNMSPYSEKPNDKEYKNYFDASQKVILSAIEEGKTLHMPALGSGTASNMIISTEDKKHSFVPSLAAVASCTKNLNAAQKIVDGATTLKILSEKADFPKPILHIYKSDVDNFIDSMKKFNITINEEA